MALSDQVIAVGKMQRYIDVHCGDEITLDDLGRVAGYSKYHAARIFKEQTGRTPFQTIRALRLTRAAQVLQHSGRTVIDTALDHGFETHDGFTRAFARQFHITPREYSQETPPVHWFINYPIESYYLMKEGVRPMSPAPLTRTMTVTAVERPARKLILLRSTTATDYLSYCEEMGCDWEGLLTSIPEKFDAAALLTLPPELVEPGTGNTASGVEVPLDYSKEIPPGYDLIELPPCLMLYFQGAPFEDDNDFGEAITTLCQIMDEYDPTQYSWQYAPELAPAFNFGASATMGAKMARPAQKL